MGGGVDLEFDSRRLTSSFREMNCFMAIMVVIS